MTFRTRVAAAAAVVVAVAVLLACGAAYKGSRDALIGSADSSLTSALTSVFTRSTLGVPTIDLDSAPGISVMLVGQTGAPILRSSVGSLPVDAVIRAVAAGTSRATFRTITTSYGPLRELIYQIPKHTFVRHLGELEVPVALVLVDPVQGIEDRVHSLAVGLMLLALAGVIVAALFGWLAARAALIPLAETTHDIEQVATTLDVSMRVAEGSNDELGRLRRAFNRLLEELELSQDQQRQLILDSSHELRTPLTSLRANAQVLGRIDELESDDVAQLSHDMVTQVDELTRLVGDLTELTRGEHSEEEAAALDLGELVNECAEIAETHARTSNVTVEVHTEPFIIRAKRNRLSRAIGNLLDNAIKFTPEGGVVRVESIDSTVTVDDSGPGIDDADRPFVFDRFYRSSRDRGLPGSGLGLAIVAQVVREAGGTIEATQSATLGGARMVVHLPVAGDPESF